MGGQSSACRYLRCGCDGLDSVGERTTVGGHDAPPKVYCEQHLNTRRSLWADHRVTGPWSRAGALLLGCALLAVSKGPLYTVRRALSDLPVGKDFIDDRMVQGSFLAIYLCLGLWFWAERNRLWYRSRLLVVTHIFLIGVIASSSLWSVGSRRSAEQAVMMLMGTGSFMLAAAGLSPRQVVNALWGATTAGILVSLSVGVVGWGHAFDHNGDLVGIYFNRNSLGAVAALGLLASVAAAIFYRSKQARLAIGLGGGMHALTLGWSGSLTPTVAALGALGTMLCVHLVMHRVHNSKARRRIFVAAGLATTLGFAGLWSIRGIIAGSLGRSPTLSGRTEIWAEVIVSWQQRPLAGYGFMAVWFDPQFRQRLIGIGRNVHEAHSGYLEVLVGAGLIGALGLLSVLIVAVGAAIRRIHQSPDGWGIWMLGALVFVVIANLGETYVGANLLVWTLLIVVCVQCCWPAGSTADVESTGVHMR